ncbi:DUF397 domain-containing protein [Saccharothrix variisporea]|uniref:Uncharacterized protein DUF397 n=1 Tax=Saccharothrix variisporea TaxID=543527 RepID=A0A495XGY0_9PSEU|nr:DUF397 domain-containing protein [Saccharothrix variisporea]RKT73307.1 uncharacterized protein DUF397 [Saccharothrix variisporea]
MQQEWRKSKRSSASGPECVEIALSGTGAAVRDSKNRGAGALSFGSVQWERFVEVAKRGRYDECEGQR